MFVNSNLKHCISLKILCIKKHWKNEDWVGNRGEEEEEKKEEEDEKETNKRMQIKIGSNVYTFKNNRRKKKLKKIKKIFFFTGKNVYWLS